MKNASPRIVKVSPCRRKLTLLVTWRGGLRSLVDLTDLVNDFEVLAPLENQKVFAQVAVGNWGWCLTWGADIEIASSTIERLGRQQARLVADGKAFCTWLVKNRLSTHRAASALGISPRMVGYYKKNDKALPRRLSLACVGWEVMAQEDRAAKGVVHSHSLVRRTAGRKGTARALAVRASN